MFDHNQILTFVVMCVRGEQLSSIQGNYCTVLQIILRSSLRSSCYILCYCPDHVIDCVIFQTMLQTMLLSRPCYKSCYCPDHVIDYVIFQTLLQTILLSNNNNNIFADTAKERFAAYQASWLILNHTPCQAIMEVANATIVI